MIENLAGVLFKRNLFGFFCLDLVAFKDPFSSKGAIGGSSELFWVNGLTCNYTDRHAGYHLSSVVTGRFEDNLDKSIVVLPYLMYKSMPTLHYKSFFHMTRLESLYFDVKSRSGVLFLVAEYLKSGVMGLVAIESSVEQTYGLVLRALGFVRKQTNEKKERYELFKETGDLPQIHEIFGKIKVDLKNMIDAQSISK